MGVPRQGEGETDGEMTHGERGTSRQSLATARAPGRERKRERDREREKASKTEIERRFQIRSEDSKGERAESRADREREMRAVVKVREDLHSHADIF